MIQETHYKYQKRIKELEAENSLLRDERYIFRSVCNDLYEGMVEQVTKNTNGINIGWCLKQLKRVWR